MRASPNSSSQSAAAAQVSTATASHSVSLRLRSARLKRALSAPTDIAGAGQAVAGSPSAHVGGRKWSTASALVRACCARRPNSPRQPAATGPSHSAKAPYSRTTAARKLSTKNAAKSGSRTTASFVLRRRSAPTRSVPAAAGRSSCSLPPQDSPPTAAARRSGPWNGGNGAALKSGAGRRW